MSSTFDLTMGTKTVTQVTTATRKDTRMSSTFDLTMGTKTADENGPAGVVVVIEQGSFRFHTSLTVASARSWAAGLQTCADELETLSLVAGQEDAEDFVRQVFDADEFARFCADPERRAMMRTLLDSLDAEEEGQ